MCRDDFPLVISFKAELLPNNAFAHVSAKA